MAITGAAIRPFVRALPAAGYDWLVLAACAWLVAGGYLDAWAHNHLATLDTFFTPWHGVLYSGFAACALVLGVRWFREGSLPAGYGLSLVGCVFFGLGGIGDMIWHTVFGIERQLAAVLSPSHLALIVSASLIVTGTVRAARAGADRRAPVVLVLGAAVVLAWLGLTTQVAQPYTQRLAASFVRGTMPYNQAIQIGLFGVMLQSALLTALVLHLRDRFELPFGSLTLILGVEAFMIGFATTLDFMVLVAVLGGLAGDIWLRVLRGRPAGLFAFAFPFTLYAVYVSSLILVYGTWWEVHAVTGIAVVAGITGWLVSFLMRPRAARTTAAEG